MHETTRKKLAKNTHCDAVCSGMRVSGGYKFHIHISQGNLFTDNDDKHTHTYAHTSSVEHGERAEDESSK